MNTDTVTDAMRTIEIRSGSVDVRVDRKTGDICLVFEARGAQVRLFRTMSREEAEAFARHLAERLRGSEP